MSIIIPSLPANHVSSAVHFIGNRAVRRSRFIIYDLHDVATDRHYVGVTCRTLLLRTRGHIYQARRDRSVRAGSLGARLRELAGAGQNFTDVFVARIVDHAATKDEARDRERQWISTLNSAFPIGYNLLPGGSSLGGPSNSRPMTIRRGRHGTRRFAAIGEAIEDRNAFLAAEGKPLLQPSTVYARLAAGWTPTQALGWRQREDGRGRRTPFLLFGRRYTSLARAAQATGLTQNALRSRLHRLKWDPQGSETEIGLDRRSQGRGNAALLSIVWPETGETLTAAEFSKRAGMPKATVIARWHRIKEEAEASGGSPPSSRAIYDVLLARIERRRPVTLTLPNGLRWTGGEREVIRRLMADPVLSAGRAEALSESGIRRRLRSLREDDRDGVDEVRWAFGFVARRNAGTEAN